jgi:DNA-binding Lrp family transcriptional regulator
MAHFNHYLIFIEAENARSKLRDVSVALKRSPQRLKYSLKTLEKERILNNTHCVFDYSYFGLILFRVYFKGGYISDDDKAAIVKQLMEIPSVVSIYELSGEFDLAIEMESKNPSRFNKELKRVTDLVPTLNSYKILLNIVTHIYPRLYLAHELQLIPEMEQSIIVGGDRDSQVFSSNEKALMRVLQANPRMRHSRIAKASAMNIRTMKECYKNLRDKKIIRGFKHMIDCQKLGISKVRLFLKLQNMTQERDAQMLSFMARMSEIVQVNKTVGDWDMEVDIESFDKTRTKFIVNDLRSTFKESIASFNFIEFNTFYKKSYLPDNLFDETRD